MRFRLGCGCGVESGGGGQVADVEHLLDGGDAGDRLFAELANAVAERTEEAAIDVDGAAAHAGDDAGVLGLGAVEAGEDHVLAGASAPVEEAEDFDIHGLGLGAFKDGPGGAVEAAVDFREGEDSGAGGRGASGGLGQRAG